MNFDITRQSLPRTILYFLLMFAIFKGREYLFSPFGVLPSEALTSLGESLCRMAYHTAWIGDVIALILVFTNAFFITRIISRNMVYIGKTYMPATIYLLVSLGYYWTPVSLITLAVAFFIIFAIENILDSLKKRYALGPFFNASIGVGLAMILYAPAGFFFVLVLGCLIFLRRGWRDWIISIAGFLMPLFIYSYVHWGMGDDFLHVYHQLISIITREVFPPEAIINAFGAWEIILGSTVVLIFILSLITFAQRKNRLRKRAVIAYNIFLGAFVISAGLFLLPCRSLAMLPLIAVPLAAAMPGYFNLRSGLIPNLLYAVLILSFLIYNLLPIIRAI